MTIRQLETWAKLSYPSIYKSNGCCNFCYKEVKIYTLDGSFLDYNRIIFSSCLCFGAKVIIYKTLLEMVSGFGFKTGPITQLDDGETWYKILDAH